MSRPTIAAMTAYTLELREARTKLNQNESPFDLPMDLKKYLMEQMVRRDWNRYPDFESSILRKALAESYGLNPENVLVGNGSNELLDAAIGTFVGPGTPVVIPRPTFTLYDKLVTIAGGTITHVDIDPATGLLPADAIVEAASALENPVIIVCSPNNPTGGVLPEGAIPRLLDTGATLLFDRAYDDFAETDQTLSLAASIPPLHDRLVTFSTFSKAWGMAGLRVGWLASTGDTCREIRKVKLPYSLNIVSESAATLSLKNRHLRDRNVSRIVGERLRVFETMQAMEGIEVFPTRANFITFRVQSAAKEVFEKIFARGILIRNVSAYHGLANCLRVSIGTPVENDAFLEALKEIA